MRRWLAAFALLLWGAAAAAQGQGSGSPNGVFLVAKPDLADPNFAKAVVLVTQTEDYSTVGVIINRPTVLKLADFVSDPGLDTSKYGDRLYLGGPVMRNALLAVFQSDTPPEAPAFHVLRKLYLTMHPDNVVKLLASDAIRYRLYAGFSGWAPRQLESEFNREGWYVLPADEEIVFRKDTGGIWDELVERARALKTGTAVPLRKTAPQKARGPAEGGAGTPG